MRLSQKDYLFVGIQLLLFLAYVIPLRFLRFTIPEAVQWFGFLLLIVGAFIGVLAVLQLNTSLSPFPSPKIQGKLVKHGVFALVRHPIYFAILSAAFGYGLSEMSDYKLLISLLLGILFHFKSNYEEKLLSKKYPDYSDYQQKTGRLLPRVFRR